jgi:long-chain acyl-CoA synthetase
METLVGLLEGAARRFAGLPVMTLHTGRGARWTWTYAQLWDHALRVAGRLMAAGVQKGDRVVLWGPNRPEWGAAFFGVQLAGAIAVPLDLRSPEDLLVRIEAQTQPRHLLVGAEQAARLTGHHPPRTHLEDVRDLAPDLAPAERPPVRSGDIAELVFTSGTTGTPKGVILTHGNVLANALQSRHVVPPSPRMRALSILPLSHMFEQQGGLFVPLLGGASVHHVATLRPDAIFDAMNAGRITNMCCVPQVLQLFREGIEREVRRQGRERLFRLLHRVGRRLPFAARRLLFRQVRARMGGAFDFFVSGGAYLEPALALWWETMGIKVMQGYGATEAAPVVSASRLADRDPYSVGRPLPGVAVRIADDGEILVRGPNVTPGYWQNEAATREAFVDGWYRTGDLGYFDPHGRLHLRGRKKSLIVLPNGMNVYPEDVERALLADPRVKDAVVVGLSAGQDVQVHAVLVLAPEVDAAEVPAILRAANAGLAPHQHVRGHTVWPEESFPLTPTLKPRLGEIHARLAELRPGCTLATR